MRVLTAAMFAILLSTGAAFAQTSTSDPLKPDTGGLAPTAAPGTGSNAGVVAQNTLPTPAQCTAGYQAGMSWTRDEFLKACAQKKDTGK